MNRFARTPARRRRMPRGQAVVEFALVAPWFFLLLFGIVEAGRFMLYYETLNNATREGARYAIVNGANTLGCPTGPPAPGSIGCDTTGANVAQKVKDSAFGVLGSGVAVTPTWDPDNARGSTVTVAASYTYRSLVPLVPLPDITVQAESSLVVNN